jgi:hypothetical protein
MKQEIKNNIYYLTDENGKILLEIAPTDLPENQIILTNKTDKYAGPVDLLFDESKFYFVATIRKVDGFEVSGTRIVGYFRTLQEAKDCVAKNSSNFYKDGCYPYVVIEGAEPGLYPATLDSIWYKWEGNFETGGYKIVEKPSELKSIINFTIG